jgi:hypothetical protein
MHMGAFLILRTYWYCTLLLGIFPPLSPILSTRLPNLWFLGSVGSFGWIVFQHFYQPVWPLPV